MATISAVILLSWLSYTKFHQNLMILTLGASMMLLYHGHQHSSSDLRWFNTAFVLSINLTAMFLIDLLRHPFTYHFIKEWVCGFLLVFSHLLHQYQKRKTRLIINTEGKWPPHYHHLFWILMGGASAILTNQATLRYLAFVGLFLRLYSLFFNQK
jgi:hypothetical protein